MRKLWLMLYYGFAKKLPYRPIPGHQFYEKIRYFLCKRIFKECGKNVVIKQNAYFGDGKHISVGDYSQIGINSKIDNDTTIGKYVLMGPNVTIFSTSHDYESLEVPMMFQGEKERRPVTIGDDVWIGTNVCIMPGVTVGNHVIIGSNAVVTKDVPDYAVVGGVPAKIIRYRNEKKRKVSNS